MSVLFINLLILMAITNVHSINSTVKMNFKNLTKITGTQSYPITKPQMEFRIAMISDLGERSKILGVNNSFYSFFKKGTLTYNSSSQKMEVKFDSGEENGTQLYSEYGNRNGRGFELSDLTYFKGNLVAADDQTGLLYVYHKGNFETWVAVSKTPDSGVENSMDVDDDRIIDIEDREPGKRRGFAGMPIEWATATDDSMFVGPNGKDGPNFVAEIKENGDVKFHNFTTHFDNLKNKAGIKQGYMTHESCVYSKIHKKFFFLPKTASNNEYSEQADLENAINKLLSITTNMQTTEFVADIKHSTVHKDRGYSSFAFIPNTDDKVIVALQTSDITNATYITAFTIEGKVIFESTKIVDVQFEGFVFL